MYFCFFLPVFFVLFLTLRYKLTHGSPLLLTRFSLRAVRPDGGDRQHSQSGFRAEVCPGFLLRGEAESEV